MSDYFGALMRASGLRLGAAADIGRTPPNDGDRVGLEAAFERSDLRQERSIHNARDEAATPLQVASERDIHDGEARDAADAMARGQHTPRNTREQVAVVSPADSSQLKPTPPADVRATASETQAHTPQALLQTALRWVATGEVPSGEQAAQSVMAQSRESIEDASLLATERNEIVLPSTKLGVTLAVPPAEPTRDSAITRSRALPYEPLDPGLPASRSDAIEVAIGAIHVRVDAPAAQTSTQPATLPTSPVARPAAATRAPHSSRLARRGLRRI